MPKCSTRGLARNGLKVHLADTAKEALNLIEKVTPEAVVAEVQLPDMNGLDLLEILKNKFPSVPVILMTGEGKVSDAVEAMRKGAEDYLLKPFAADRLEAVIHRALFENPAKARQNEASSPIPRFSVPIITQDRRLKEILDLCRKVAASKATILIQGESGTGKGTLGSFSPPGKSQASGAFCGRELRLPAGNPSRKRIVRP